jgi:hypothetical protein
MKFKRDLKAEDPLCHEFNVPILQFNMKYPCVIASEVEKLLKTISVKAYNR